MQRSAVSVLAGLVVASAAMSAHAQFTIVDPYFNLENRNINSLGTTPGQFMRIGATSVVPNGGSGTTAFGTTVDLVTGQTVTRTIPWSPGPFIPNFFQRVLADTPSQYGPWTLTFQNGSTTVTRVVTLPANTTQVPFVNSITISGSSATPTFSWTPPPNTTVNGYRLNIFDKSLIGPGNNGQVASRNVLPSVTSYTINPADFTVAGYAFELGRNYSLEISVIQTKDGLSTDLGNDNLRAIARSYADFRPNNSSGPAVNLPVVLENGSFQFDITVVPNVTYYIDPDVAVGYDYRIGAGDPSFASVVLPAGIGDGLFDIFAIGSAGELTLLADDWSAGSVFTFASGGLGAFRVTGIEVEAAIDPSNTTAFVTGLTFSGAGKFTGTQTPLTVAVAAIPEPETYALMLAGLAALGWTAKRRRGRLQR